MSFEVKVKKSVEKSLKKLPQNIRKNFNVLLEDLRDKGPILKNWPNFSSIGTAKYHCHLAYHWVACWRCENESIVIEVYYAGSREKAPY